MQSRLATQQDLRVVFGDLAQRCIDEIAAANFTMHEAKVVFRGLRRSECLWALVLDSVPLGLIGLKRDVVLGGFPILGTYFLGREKFFEPAVPSVRFGRKFMREMQARFDNLPMVSMCYGTHPQIERWYGLMGYRLAETFGVQRNFVLDPIK